jgi:hypothetical protein
MVDLIVKTTKCPFHESEIKELAFKVIPRRIKKLEKPIVIKDVRLHHLYGGSTYVKDLVIEINCNARKRFIKEEPFTREKSNYGTELGYNKYEEFETETHFTKIMQSIKERDAEQYAKETQ